MTTTDLVARESSLITTARTLALAVLEDPKVKTALSVAATTKGLVITNETEATLANDQLAVLLAGEKQLAAEVKRVTDIGEAIKKAARGSVAEQTAAISGAVLALKQSIQAHLARERQAAERERLRLEQERIAREALAAESLADEPEAPPLEMPAPVAPKRVVSGSGQSYETRTLCCESVNFHDWEPEWATLNTAAAKSAMREEARRGNLPEPGDESKPVVWRGVRFWYRIDLAHSGTVRR